MQKAHLYNKYIYIYIYIVACVSWNRSATFGTEDLHILYVRGGLKI